MTTNTNDIQPDSGFSHDWFEVIDESSRRWNFKQVIHRIWSSVTELFSPSSELRIFTGRDRHGNTYYRVYDVLTQDLHRFESEDEVRIWLEQSYYYYR